MYKVFINEQLITFSETARKTPFFDSFLEVFDPSEDEIKMLVDWLFLEDSVFHLNLISKDREAWELFNSAFPLIKAAGGVVRNPQNKLLCIERLGKWDLPKGKMEAGEKPEESAIREVEEECGIDQLKIGKQLPSTHHMYSIGEKKVLKETYWFSMQTTVDQKLTPQADEGITKVRWVGEEEIPEIRSNTYPSLLSLIA